MLKEQSYGSHPNATKHFEEFIVSPNIMNEFIGSFVSPVQQTLHVQEFLLTDFYNALKELIKNGIPYTKTEIRCNNWGIIFAEARNQDMLPCIKHAIRN